MVSSNFYIEKQAGRYYQSIKKTINLINYLKYSTAKPLNINLIFYKHKLLYMLYKIQEVTVPYEKYTQDKIILWVISSKYNKTL